MNKQPSARLKAAFQAVHDSAVFAGMCSIAYAPVKLPPPRSAAESLVALTKAQEKRLKKQMKRASQLATNN